MSTGTEEQRLEHGVCSVTHKEPGEMAVVLSRITVLEWDEVSAEVESSPVCFSWVEG